MRVEPNHDCQRCWLYDGESKFDLINLALQLVITEAVYIWRRPHPLRVKLKAPDKYSPIDDYRGFGVLEIDEYAIDVPASPDCLLKLRFAAKSFRTNFRSHAHDTLWDWTELLIIMPNIYN